MNAVFDTSASMAAHRLEFAPPPTPGMLRAMGLAIIAHMLLVAALTWGVNWKSDPVAMTADAELWSAVPQQAAPKLEQAPAPPPAPVVVAPPPPPVVAPKTPDADIALERERQRMLREKRLDDEHKAQDKKRANQQREKQKEVEKQKDRALKDAAQKDKEKKALEDQKKVDAKLAQTRQTEQADAKKLEDQRQENMKRMAGLAGATGAANATGAAQQAAGPSAGYAGRIRARIKPNIVFTEDVAGNPTAEVEVRTAPDGTIIGKALIKPSASAAWNEAVLKAIDKTEVLPRDVDGRVPPSLVISFRPKD